MANESLVSLNTLRNIFIEGWKYILQYGPALGKSDIFTILSLMKEARKTDLTMEKLGALAVLSVLIPGSNFGFKRIEPLNKDPAKTTCFQFGQGRVGWYFMYGNSTKVDKDRDDEKLVENVGFSFIVFRIELAPPEIIKSHKLNPSESVLYFIAAGCGKKTNNIDSNNNLEKCNDYWWVLPKTLLQAKYKCLSRKTFELTAIPGTASALHLFKLRSRNPGLFQINAEWTDPDTGEQIEIYANLTASGPAVYNSVGGYIPCSDGIGSLYWSYTNMKVKMNIGDSKSASQSYVGTGWFDHQWTGSIASIDPQVERWLWLTLQLFDETQYMVVINKFKDSDIIKGHIFDPILVNKYEKTSCDSLSISNVSVEDRVLIDPDRILEKNSSVLLPEQASSVLVKYNIGNTTVEILDTVLIGNILFPTKYKITIIENNQSNVYILKNAFGDSLVNMLTGGFSWEGPGNVYNEDESQLIGLGFLEANLATIDVRIKC